MVWVRTPDDFWEREEVLEIGIEAAALHLAALGYANRNLTDGRLPAAKAMTLLAFGEADVLIDALVSAGWWTETDVGFQIVYLLDLQPTAAAVTAKREKTARRVAEHRERHALERSNGVSHAARTEASRNPDPDPDPDPGPGPALAVLPSSHGRVGRKRDADASRQNGSITPTTAPLRGTASPSAPQAKKRTATQVKLAEIVDHVRAEGIPIHPTSRDGAALKSCAAPAALIAEAYSAAARREWDPVGDGFLNGNLSLHLVISRLAGYSVSVAGGPPSYVWPVGRGPGHNVHGPGCDCPTLPDADLLTPAAEPVAEPAF